jgi:hypothetical protein
VRHAPPNLVLDRTSIELISQLPPQVGESLGFAKGGFQFIFNEVDSMLKSIKQLPEDKVKKKIVFYAKELEAPTEHVIQFLLWFNSTFPSEAEGAATNFLEKMRIDLKK